MLALDHEGFFHRVYFTEHEQVKHSFISRHASMFVWWSSTEMPPGVNIITVPAPYCNICIWISGKTQRSCHTISYMLPWSHLIPYFFLNQNLKLKKYLVTRMSLKTMQRKWLLPQWQDHWNQFKTALKVISSRSMLIISHCIYYWITPRTFRQVTVHVVISTRNHANVLHPKKDSVLHLIPCHC